MQPAKKRSHILGAVDGEGRVGIVTDTRTVPSIMNPGLRRTVNQIVSFAMGTGIGCAAGDALCIETGRHASESPSMIIS